MRFCQLKKRKNFEFNLLKTNFAHNFSFSLIFSLIVTFFSAKNVLGKFNVLGDNGMWEDTFSYNIINNPLIFLIVIFIAYFSG